MRVRPLHFLPFVAALINTLMSCGGCSQEASLVALEQPQGFSMETLITLVVRRTLAFRRDDQQAGRPDLPI